MGYFAGRAAPMGPVMPAVVHATFFNFAPSMTARALPDAWTLADPSTVLDARMAGSTRALGSLLAEDAEGATVQRAADLCRQAATQVTVDGRPLAAANAALAWPDEPLPRLWHATTVLREHRGDGHVTALVEAEVDGCEAHVLLIADGATTRAAVQRARGWTDEQWTAATDRLVDRGLLEPNGTLTAAGTRLRRQVESTTDRLALEPWRRLGRDRCDELTGLLDRLATRVLGVGLIPSANPMGLPIAR